MKNNQGMALVLSVLILTNLFIISFIVADIVIRISKTGHEIGQSEIAYLAAETAIEKSIYHIEANRNITGIGTIQSPDEGALDYNTNGTWSRYALASTDMRVTCVDSNGFITYPEEDPDDGENSCLYTDNPGDITSDNPLIVHLQDGKSFQLELDIDGLNYPSYLTVSWQNKREGSVIVLDLNEEEESKQTIYDTNEVKTCTIPQSGVLSASQRFRIINQSGSDMEYSIEPSLSDYSLPVGVLIHSQGNYQNKHERIIEVERRNWLIY